MYLENVVFDAVDPQALGRSWEATLGTATLTDEEAGYETRLAVPDGPVLDLCFQRVPAEPEGEGRLHLEVDGGELTTLRLEVADLGESLAFWEWLTGWVPVEDGGAALQHPTRRGPVLALVVERAPKSGVKNRVHLDVRLEPGDSADEVAAGIAERGGRELHLGWGYLPWRHFADPSGNELCVLKAAAHAAAQPPPEPQVQP